MFDHLSAMGAIPRWIASDCSLGCWRGHAIAREFVAQLEIGPEAVADFPGERPIARSYANVIGEGIDTEAAGETIVLRTLEWVDRVVTAVRSSGPVTFIIFVPRFGFEWEPENELFVRFLAQNIPPHSALHIAAPEAEEVVIPQEWIVNWQTLHDEENDSQAEPCIIPGIAKLPTLESQAKRQTATSSGWISLSGEFALVSPYERRSFQGIPRSMFDRLAIEAKDVGWLQAYALYHGNNIYVQAEFLASEAWRRYAEGGITIALRLLDRAIECASRPVQEGALRCQAAGMRIAVQHFPEVASIPDPSPGFPAEIIFFLYQAKGWGLALSGNAEEALRYLQLAQTCAPANLNVGEQLYLRNILALVRFKMGDLDGALESEAEIDRILGMLKPPDARLSYINAINLARLHLRRKEWERAEASYRRAFYTVVDLASESDRVHVNVCFAKLNAARGQPAMAFHAWFLAALNLLACAAPEAIAPRVAASILESPASSPWTLPERLAKALRRHLGSTAEAAGLNLAQVLEGGRDRPTAAFAFAECQEEGSLSRIFSAVASGADWSVLCSTEKLALVFEGEEWNALRKLIHCILRWYSDVCEVSEAQTFILDPGRGLALPSSPADVLGLSFKWRIPTIIGRKSYFLPFSRRQMDSFLIVRLSRAVDELRSLAGEIRVTFKRYLPPRAVGGAEAHLLAQLQPALSKQALRDRCFSMPDDDFEQALRGLEEKQIIKLNINENIITLQRLAPNCV